MRKYVVAQIEVVHTFTMYFNTCDKLLGFVIPSVRLTFWQFCRIYVDDVVYFSSSHLLWQSDSIKICVFSRKSCILIFCWYFDKQCHLRQSRMIRSQRQRPSSHQVWVLWLTRILYININRNEKREMEILYLDYLIRTHFHADKFSRTSSARK